MHVADHAHESAEVVDEARWLRALGNAKQPLGGLLKECRCAWQAAARQIGAVVPDFSVELGGSASCLLEEEPLLALQVANPLL
jgi:hypothetical protein